MEIETILSLVKEEDTKYNYQEGEEMKQNAVLNP